MSVAYLLGGRPIFFPFSSGTLRYSCEGCEAPCCKGQPLGIGASRELVVIQTAQPRAPLFASSSFRSSALLSLRAPPEKCWFLDKKSRCRLEYVIGRDAKPSGCRLFPFTLLRGVGEALAVIPDFLCPIEIGDPTATGPTSHDELALEMHRTQVPRGGHPDLPAPPDVAWDDAMPLERRIVQESKGFFAAESYVGFAERQHELTAASFAVDGRPGAMGRLDDDIRRFLAVSEQPSQTCVRDLVALTGILRTTAHELPRRSLPGVLLALSVLAGVYEHMKGSRRSARTLVAMWRERAPLLFALAHLNSRPIPRPGGSIDRAVSSLGLVRAPLIEAAQEIVKNGRRGVPLTLEEILREQREAFAPPLTADAVATLHGLGQVLLQASSFVPA